MMKIVITLWTSEIDPFYTGDESFSVMGEFLDLPAAQAYLNDNVDRLIAEQLSQHPGWRLTEQGQSDQGLSGLRGLKDNKVVYRRHFGVGDGTCLHSIYFHFLLIELPSDAVVDENLFDLVTCGYFVRPYFHGLGKK